MPKVNYGGKVVTDENVKTVLARIATELGKDVNVSSGDRSSVPSGGSKTSHHLKGRAADFHVAEMSDEEAFKQIQEKKDKFFDSDEAYQCIRHGTSTETMGAHIHVGRYGDDDQKTPGVQFLIEGLDSNGKGKYTVANGYASLPSAQLAYDTIMSERSASYLAKVVC